MSLSETSKNSTRRLNFYVYKEKPCCWGRSGLFLKSRFFFSFFFPELFFRLTLPLIHEFAEATELTAVRSVGRGEAQHQVLYIKVGQRAHREHRWTQHAERTLDLTAEHKASRTMVRTGWPSIISVFFFPPPLRRILSFNSGLEKKRLWFFLSRLVALSQQAGPWGCYPASPASRAGKARRRNAAWLAAARLSATTGATAPTAAVTSAARCAWTCALACVQETAAIPSAPSASDCWTTASRFSAPGNGRHRRHNNVKVSPLALIQRTGSPAGPSW